MGEKKARQSRTKRLIAEHPWCIYCGAPATTTDHFPPRCFFRRRNWPEGYEFPSCSDCNSQARNDEQALAVLLRSDTFEEITGADEEEWKRLARGLKNNAPEIINEWTEYSGAKRKRQFREAFGSKGDQLRHEGWGLVNIGPKTDAAIERIMIKTSKSIYYKHTGKIFNGILYLKRFNTLFAKDLPSFLDSILEHAPQLVETKRNNVSLSDQFMYRINYSSEHEAMYAVVRYSRQFLFAAIALGREFSGRLEKDISGRGFSGSPLSKHNCYLEHSQAVPLSARPADPE
ncbi:hypothetical protein [Azospirillum brasilense]|uniref:hypothetical protein n=1 Tax=Azospirillum brasilense TaxID=192 RepID=UPI0011778BDE|nr:hypothetical protein [Azospirillum brasilense]